MALKPEEDNDIAYAITMMVIIVVLCNLLGGCSVLEPNKIGIEADHVSHISQHFGSDATNFGYNTLGVVAHWQSGNAYVDLSEAYNFGSEFDDGRGYGALWGPRETFTGRVGYAITLR